MRKNIENLILWIGCILLYIFILSLIIIQLPRKQPSLTTILVLLAEDTIRESRNLERLL